MACNLIIASNKQRLELLRHNPESESQRSLWVVQEPPICKNLELKCKPNKNVHGHHWRPLPYDNNGWERKLDETNTLLSTFPLNLRVPFLIIYLNFQFLNSLFNCMCIREKFYLSLMCTMYANASNITPYTRVSSYLVQRVPLHNNGYTIQLIWVVTYSNQNLNRDVQLDP